MMNDNAAAASAITVRYFGPLLDITGTHAEPLRLTLPDNVAGIDRQIRMHHPGLESHQYRVAVDDTLRAPADEVSAAREIALLPPFSGG